MQLDARFAIDKKTRITITVPEKYDKETHYYEPGDTIHAFDVSPVRLISTNICLDLYREHIRETITMLHATTYAVLTHDNTLPAYISPGTVGKELEKCTNNISADSNTIYQALVWGHCVPINTLLYSINRAIYIEIAPAYRWLFTQASPKERYIYHPIEVYLHTYKPYIFKRLSYDTVEQWHTTCCNILQSL